MDCKKAQRSFDDLSRERLAPELAAEVRQHLADCTDCRVLEQRAARLQRLLALKRYEQPAPQYFDNFLTEFHRRLLAETQPRIGWSQRVYDLLSTRQTLVWRYGFAGAMGIVLAVGLMWMGLSEMTDSGTGDQVAAVNPPLTVTSAAESAPQSAPLATALQLAGTLHVAPVDYEAAPTENVIVPSLAMHTESDAPQYVLDRISVTPASYEVARVYF
ncbi:MAG TPA: zf-HC2 domain-containing protein [Verrucomicrobiae bacterium]|nr:zf-HC2 domain-containing protein [Verrucomicrobiae bacterium]